MARHCTVITNALLALAAWGCAPASGEVVEQAGIVGEDVLPFGGCLPGGNVSICEDPVTATSPEANKYSGTLLPSGFRIDDKGDRVTFDLGDDAVSGAVRFTLTGIGPESLAQDTVVLLLATDTPELDNPEPTRMLELKIWGSAVMPEESGNTRGTR